MIVFLGDGTRKMLGLQKNTNNELTVYWASAVPPTHGNWTMLYSEPKNLYKMLMDQRNPEREINNYLLCPAASGDFKKTFVTLFPHDASYKYNFENGNQEIFPTSKEYINFNIKRNPTVLQGPTVEFSMAYSFFCEEDLIARFTPPMFHQPKHTRYATVVPGSFNIGSWFRPYPLEMQLWNNSGEIFFEENEPLFYVNFETERPIKLKRFVFTEEIHALQTHCIKYYSQEYSLTKRYNTFKKSDMHKLVLHEIKKNLIDKD